MVRPSPASPRLSRSAMPSHIASSVFLSRSGTDRPRRGRACRATRGGVGRMGSKHKKNKAKKTQSKQTASSEAQVASGASGTEEAEENEPGRANQAALWCLGLRIEPIQQRNTGSAREGCGARDWVAAALHTLWSYDPSPITRPQTHILRAFCRLTSPCLAHRRDGDSPAAASKHRPTSACCARRRPPRRLALPCSASITTPGRAPAAPARRTRPGGRTATVERKSEIARGHRARVCGLWSNHCMVLAIWTRQGR